MSRKQTGQTSGAGVGWDVLGLAQLRGSVDDDGVERSLIEEIDTALGDLGEIVRDLRSDGRGSITVTISMRREEGAVIAESRLVTKRPQPERRAVVAIPDVTTGELLTQSTRQTSIFEERDLDSELSAAADAVIGRGRQSRQRPRITQQEEIEE